MPWGVGLVWDWQWDSDLYPDFPGMVSLLRNRNVRVMSYVNPHLVNATGLPGHSRSLFQESLDNGYVVLNGDGSVFMSYLNATMIDLSNDEARNWFKGVIKNHILSTGVSGWMCDFGEALPLDAKLHSSPQARQNPSKGTPVFKCNVVQYSLVMGPMMWANRELASVVSFDFSTSTVFTMELSFSCTYARMLNILCNFDTMGYYFCCCLFA